MEPTPSPMFATVGRPRRGGSARSRGVMLLVAGGVTLSTIAFFWEMASREHLTIVEVRLSPMDAEASP